MEAVMYKRFILLLGLFLGTHIPTAAQTPAPQIVPAREQVASITTTVRMVPAAVLAAPFLLFENPAQSAAHFSSLLQPSRSRATRSCFRYPSLMRFKTRRTIHG